MLLKRRKVLASVFVSGLLLSSLAACGEKSSEGTATSEGDKSGGQVKLSFLQGNPEMVEWFNTVIDEFNKQNPGITVVQENSKEPENLLKVKFASGDVPDITNRQPQEFIDKGLFLDLSDHEQWWSRLSPEAKEASSDLKTGKQFKVVTNFINGGIFYNKSMFNKFNLQEALTWDDFMKNLRSIKEQDSKVVPMYMSGKDAWTIAHLGNLMAEGVQKQKVGNLEFKKASLDNNVDILKFDEAGGPLEILASHLLELKKEELINKNILSDTYDQQIDAFANGKAAMISQGMWALADILNKNPEIVNDLGFSPYPSIVNGTKPTVLNADDQAYSIPAGSKHIEEAKKFLDFLFEAENQKSFSETRKAPSAFTDVEADWAPIKDQVTDALSKAASVDWDIRPIGFDNNEQGQLYQELLVGTFTPEQFTKEFKTRWDNAWKAMNK
ncbi:ABC transporter substrate-binding protein [Paenibacillus sp. B-A-8]|uniref:ABC transporter substrate-binding protein n=1 Tax=Paenibacillus sp. B-A-8 TaxID=3400419 RepID=UPI003B028CA9